MKDGTLQKIIEIDQKSTTNHCNIKNQSNEETHKLNLIDVSGVLVFHFMWTVLALILAILKLQFSRRHGKNAMNKVQCQQKKRKGQKKQTQMKSIDQAKELACLITSLKDELKEVKGEMIRMRKNIIAKTLDIEKQHAKGYS